MTTDFVLDSSLFIRELQNGVSSATYLTGLRGPEYRRDDAHGGSVRWYVFDGLGSVVEEVDPSGNITASRKYDVFGSVRSSTGTSTSKHKFVGALGHPSEDETGLIYMQARYMDPVVGRFISEDPSKQGENWFPYAFNNPINNVDADGKISLGQICILLAGLEMILQWLNVKVITDLFYQAVKYLLTQLARFSAQSVADFQGANNILNNGEWGTLGSPGVYAAVYIADALMCLGVATMIGATIAFIVGIQAMAICGVMLMIDDTYEWANQEGI